MVDSPVNNSLLKAIHLLFLLLLPVAVAASPIVSNVQFSQGPAEGSLGSSSSSSVVTISYDLASPNGPCEITVMVSTDGGGTFDFEPTALEGDVGADISPGAGRVIHWDVSQDFPSAVLPNVAIRIVADDNYCNDCLLWSEPDTWGGVKPIAGEVVTIPTGTTILLDEDTPALGGLTIDGTLDFMRQDLELTSEWIRVTGELRVGTEAAPFTHQATITLNDTETAFSVMGMGTRGIMVMGGTLSLHGTPPEVAWTKIGEHVSAGSSALPLIDEVDWNPGDQVIIAPTDFYGEAGTERLTVDTVTPGPLTTINTVETLNSSRWGLLQYATTSGMSLAQDNSIVLSEEMEGTPLILDERAEVANLTRNIVIQSPDDSLWQNDGFGVHIMVMGPMSRAYIEGVEIRRGGQLGILGRYPFHCHLQSYTGGVEVGDVSGEYFRNSTINESQNRGVVIHGTNGALVQGNIIYDVVGHAIFTEDAVERRNTFDGNVVMRVRNPSPVDALMLHEWSFGAGFETGSSGFWLSNPDNVLTNNVTADVQGFGFWLAFPETPQGLNHDVDMQPNRITFGTFADNTSHSSLLSGLTVDNAELNWDNFPDHGGNVAGVQYWSTDSSTGLGWSEIEPFHLDRFTVWKSNVGGIWDRAARPRNTGIVSADNTQRFFAGSGADGVIQRSLVVGRSLNDDGGPLPVNGGNPVQTAFATYHSTFDIVNNLVLNFPLVEGERSGVFATDDYYTRGVEKGTIRNQGNVVINSHPGYKLRAFLSNTGTFQEFASWYTLSSALWDPDGMWGPAGNYFVYPTEFLTYGLPVTEVAPSAEQSGGVSVPGPFYGFNEFVLHGIGDSSPQNQPWDDLMEMDVRRLDQDLNEVASWHIDPAGASDWSLAHMRDFAAHPTGVYEISFPNSPFGIEHPSNFSMNVENMLEDTDVLLMSIHFDGAVDPFVRMSSPGNSFHYYTEVASLQDVRDSEGETWWQDTVNNRIWVKIQGGSWQSAVWQDLTQDDYLYEPTQLRIHP